MMIKPPANTVAMHSLFEIMPRDLWLGLRRDHPLIQQLDDARDSPRVFYSITFLTHQLVNCQRLLVPNSSFRNWVMDRLGHSLRNTLLEIVLTNEASNESTRN